MPSYFFVESRDPFASRDVEEGYHLLAALAAQQSPVTLFLVQNGVLAARQGAHAAQFTTLVAHPGVTVLADAFALQERGMSLDALVPGVQASDIDTLVDLLMADGQKAIWHLPSRRVWIKIYAKQSRLASKSCSYETTPSCVVFQPVP